jgi:hypothetical protein
MGVFVRTKDLVVRNGKLFGACRGIFVRNMDHGGKYSKKNQPFLDLCVSSLHRGHANLLCIVPILSGVSKETTLLDVLQLIRWHVCY